MNEREDIIAYINSLQAGQGLSEQEIKEGYQTFKAQKADNELTELAGKHNLHADTLKAFVSAILDRMIFDGEQLSDLFQPLALGWKARTKAELALMDDLVPFLKKQAQGREISGLAAYE
jgi:type I restriction enzyme R subunit